MSQRCDYLLVNGRLATMLETGEAYGAIGDGVIAVHDGRILYAGPAADVPDLAAVEVVDCGGGWLTPGLVDCHTHLVYAGSRAREFELRQQGASYEEIARAGGGILSTVAATRAAPEDELLASAGDRLQRLLEEGVTTVEVKSGYGLDLDSEMKQLRVARRLGENFPVTVQATFLGAHALPPEYRDRGGDAWIQALCRKLLPRVCEENLADAVDVYCEGVGFSPLQCAEVYRTASGLGLPIRAHAEQFSNLRGARVAAEYSARSVDHLEYLAEEDIPVLARAGTVAVLLPGAYYFLQQRQVPPVAALRRAGVPMAVATDLNPGTSPQASLLLAMNQSVLLFGLTPEEALRGATRCGAQALGLARKGVLAAGMDADIALWPIEHPAELSCGVGLHRPGRVWQAGRQVRGPDGCAPRSVG